MAPSLAFVAFAVVLAVVTVSLARRSAVLVRAGDTPPPSVMYWNVAATQVVVVALLLGGAWAAGVPFAAFGVATSPVALAVGVAAGVCLFAGSVAVTRALSRGGGSYSEALRDALAPRDEREAVTLYGVVLPLVAVGEELLFRGALVGVVAAGLGVSPWLPAVGSSLLFGTAHSAQGRVGVVVTAALGGLLAAVFVAWGLAAAVVAHYLVNALEFALAPRLTES